MKKYIYLFITIIFGILLLCISILINNNSNLKKENKILTENIFSFNNELLSYQDSLHKERGIYKFTIDELNISKDNIIKELINTKNKLNIKDKEVKQLSSYIASLKKDTTINITTIINDSCEFDLNIEYNPQTIFYVTNKKVNNEYKLTHHSYISTTLSSFIYEKKEWKESKWYKRVFLFKWGKNKTERSQIVSDNELIKIKDYKIIKIIE